MRTQETLGPRRRGATFSTQPLGSSVRLPPKRPAQRRSLRRATAVSNALVSGGVDVAAKADRQDRAHTIERGRVDRVHVVDREVRVLARLEAPFLSS